MCLTKPVSLKINHITFWITDLVHSVCFSIFKFFSTDLPKVDQKQGKTDRTIKEALPDQSKPIR